MEPIAFILHSLIKVKKKYIYIYIILGLFFTNQRPVKMKQVFINDYFEGVMILFGYEK